MGQEVSKRQKHNEIGSRLIMQERTPSKTKNPLKVSPRPRVFSPQRTISKSWTKKKNSKWMKTLKTSRRSTKLSRSTTHPNGNEESWGRHRVRKNCRRPPRQKSRNTSPRMQWDRTSFLRKFGRVILGKKWPHRPNLQPFKSATKAFKEQLLPWKNKP